MTIFSDKEQLNFRKLSRYKKRTGTMHSGVTDRSDVGPGRSDVGPFSEMGPPYFDFLCYLKHFINFKPLVYANLLFC